MGYPHKSHPNETPILSKYFGEPEARTLDGWKQRGGYRALQQALGMTPGGHRERREGIRAARPRRRRLPNGHEVVVHEAGRRQAALSLRATPTNPSPARSRIARSCGGRRTRSSRERAIGAYAIGAEVAYIYIRGEFTEPLRVMEAAVKEAYDAGILGKNAMGSGHADRHPRASRRGRVHLRRRDGADEFARRAARQSAHQAAVPRRRRIVRTADDDQQRRDAGRGAAHPE